MHEVVVEAVAELLGLPPDDVDPDRDDDGADASAELTAASRQPRGRRPVDRSADDPRHGDG